jgi:hypothetical protein
MTTPTTTPIEFGPLQVLSLEAVLAYLWEGERRDYFANPRPDHIIHDLVRLRAWLSARRHRSHQPMTVYRATLIADRTEDPVSEEEHLAAWQHLVDTGVAWQLRGFVGRTARNLLEAGLIVMPRQEAKRDSE